MFSKRYCLYSVDKPKKNNKMTVCSGNRSTFHILGVKSLPKQQVEVTELHGFNYWLMTVPFSDEHWEMSRDLPYAE